MTHMAQGGGSGKGVSEGQGWAHRTLVLVSMTVFVLWAMSVSLVHAKPKAPPPPITQVTQLGQGTLALKHGASGVLQATLSPAPTAPGVLAVSSDDPETVSVPASVAFAAGQTQVAIPVTGERKGKADVTVSLNGSSRSAKVNVTPSPSRLLSLSPAQATLQPGATLALQVALTPRKPGGAITLQLSSSDPAKVYVPASITLAEGQSTASFQARAMGAGSATISAQLNNGGTSSIATAQIQVVPAALAVVSLAPPTSSIEQGAQTTLTLTLSATASTPTTVALQARTAGVLSLPTQVVVPTGQSNASFPVQGLAIGQSLVVATLGATSAEAAVQVTPARMAINTSGNKDTAASRVYMTDTLNSVIAQLNDEDSANVANSYAYNPYGESQTIGPDATGNPIQYTSRENDGTGLYYYRNRYRDPILGWGNEDPSGFIDGFNKFRYVIGNPVMFTDPTGLWSVDIGGFWGAGANFTFGYDSATQRGFFNAQFGYGVGGGFMYSPDGGLASGQGSLVGCNGDQTFLGVFGKAGASGLGASVDVVTANAGYGVQSDRPHSGLSWFDWSFGKKWGLKAEAAGGVQMTAVTQPNSTENCSCVR